ncbi:hypothetical protein K737_300352 [Holospora undulata HU1]|uniref:Uncharacterized protein n=1 Tax=Holospora undulata HU1 TaxID=1321371 RepID=A0A061JGL5_9PROT|nr:hypothetical protein K737_300352 [Holospora undulata HU1]
MIMNTAWTLTCKRCPWVSMMISRFQLLTFFAPYFFWPQSHGKILG